MEYHPIEIAYPLLRQRRYVLQPKVAVARRLPWDHGVNASEPHRGSVPDATGCGKVCVRRRSSKPLEISPSIVNDGVISGTALMSDSVTMEPGNA